MLFMGQEKSSFVDYPNKICTVYFVGGCNFRCPYCHNGPLVKGEGTPITEAEAIGFLVKRKKYVDAVCISGGEPTLYEGIYDFIGKIKKEGFFVKLDTNGTNPKMVKRLLEERLVDYMAMDIKAPTVKYDEVAGVHVPIEAIQETMTYMQRGDLDYEFRTTVCKELLTKEDILEIVKGIKGARRYTLQNFRDGTTVLGGAGKFHPFEIDLLEEVEKEIKGFFDTLIIRK